MNQQSIHDSATEAQRRQQPRVPVYVYGNKVVGDQPYMCRLRNLSESGALLETLIEPERHRHAARIAHRAGQHPVAARVADDVVEEQRRGRFAAVVDLGNRADLKIPMGPGDVLQFPQALDARDPRAQVGGARHGWMICRYLAATSGGVASTSLRIC